MIALALALLLSVDVPPTSPAPSSPAAEGAFAEGQRLLRDRNAPDDMPTYRAALAAFGRVTAEHAPARLVATARAREAETWMRIGDLASSSARKVAAYERGTLAADAAIAADPTFSEGWFWRGAMLGRWGQARGVVQSLFALDDIQTAFAKAAALDPHDLDVKLAQALVDAQVPGFAGGSVERAEATFQEVLRIEPGFTRAMLDYADLLWALDRKDEARAWAKRALAETHPFRPSEKPRFDDPRARALLQRED